MHTEIDEQIDVEDGLLSDGVAVGLECRWSLTPLAFI